jgi:hypothetical protein
VSDKVGGRSTIENTSENHNIELALGVDEDRKWARETRHTMPPLVVRDRNREKPVPASLQL